MTDSVTLWLVAVVSIILLLSAAVYVVINERKQANRTGGLRSSLVTVLTLLVTIGAGVLFVLVTNGWMNEAALYQIDLRVQEAMTSAMPRTEMMSTGVMGVVTWFGSGYAVLAAAVILGVYLLSRRDYLDFVVMVLASGPGSGLMWMMKVYFERVRPEDPLATGAGHSFPSGHSFWAVVVYGFIIHLAWTQTRDRPFQIGLTAVLVVLILAIALSRIVLNMHWLSDVLGGLTFGLVWLGACLIAGAAAADRHRSGAT